MTKISDLTALTGASVDSTADLLPIVDMSAAGAARNKKITIDEARIGLGLGTAASPQFTGINLGHASDTTITRASAGVIAVEGVNIVTTAGGVTFAADIIVPDEAYDATAWNGSLEVPTKNAVRDKIESLGSGITELDDIPDVNAPTPADGDVLTWDSTPGEWVAAAPTGGSNALDDLTDVDAPTPSDGDVLTFDSGSGDWVPAAPAAGGNPYEASPTTIPDLSAFTTWRNQGTATVTADSYGVYFTGDNDNELHIREMNLPATPFSYYARVRHHAFSTQAETTQLYAQAGLCIVNSTNGRVLGAHCQWERIAGDENNNYVTGIDRWSSVTASVANPVIARDTTPFHWIRIDVTSTGVTLFSSLDGRRWVSIGTESFASYLTASGGGSADKLGIFCRSVSNGTNTIYNFDVLQSTAP